MAKLTAAQVEMLALVGSQHTIRSGLKGHLVGDGWRRLNRLVDLGLVERLGFGAHRITPAGRQALGAASEGRLPSNDPRVSGSSVPPLGRRSFENR